MSLENETIDGGSYHSYDPNNIIDGRTFISVENYEAMLHLACAIIVWNKILLG